jgi:predicted polyphosphate/ATP-dependent NAD kinase
MQPFGIIANPASGKDIRRLVAHASVFDNAEKANMIGRVLLGAQSVGAAHALLMPDREHLALRALHRLESGQLTLKVELLDLPVRDSAEDTTEAARRLRALGAACAVVLGGDGTCRAAAKGAGDLPLIALSTGTNNVFPQFLESTVAGMAAGLLATGALPAAAVTTRAKVVEVLRDGAVVDLALVEAALVEGRWIGARAVWDPGRIRWIVQTRATPGTVGLSAIGAALLDLPPEAEGGLALEVGPGGRKVRAPLAPGLVVDVPVRRVERVALDAEIELPEPAGVLALDGEREIELRPGPRWSLRVARRGPYVVDVRKTLACAAGWLAPAEPAAQRRTAAR